MSVRLATCFALALLVSCFEFELVGEDQKCFLESLAFGTYFRARYSSEPCYNQFLDVTFQAPDGEIIQHDKGSDSGSIASHIEDRGYYQICFTTRALPHSRAGTQTRVVSFDVHAYAGDAGDIIDHWSAARREHLEPIEQELRNVDYDLRRVHAELHELRDHESALASDLEGMNGILRYARIIVVLVCVSAAVFSLLLILRALRVHAVLE